MTEQQIERCKELDKIKKDYNHVLNILSNPKAKIVIGWLPNNCSHVVYNNICNVDFDNCELLYIVEKFIRDKLIRINEDLKNL